MATGDIDRTGLFECFRQGHGARLTVVTPNQRLAQALLRDFDRQQLAAGLTAWEAPDVLPWNAFLERAHEEAGYLVGPAPPVLLSAAEEQLLWEEALRASPWRDQLLSLPATAALAGEAWKIAHAWRIEGALAAWPGSEDAEAFVAWAAAYARRTAREGCIEAARLPGFVAARLASLPSRPARLVAYAFELATPQQEDFFAHCSREGIDVRRCESPRAPGHGQRLAFESPRRELEFAAQWARARLEAAQAAGNPAPRIAVVVPELTERRREVERVFGRVLAPLAAPGDAERLPLFNVSVGEPLAAHPLAAAALGLIDFAFAPVDFARVSRLLRSPFIAGAQAEFAARARLDAALRRLAPATLGLSRLRPLAGEAASMRGAPACPVLHRVLEAIERAAKERNAAPAHDWARRFSAILDAAGFPGERTIDSTEFQALQKLRETLALLATLGTVAPAWGAGEARARLKQLCLEATFQPASGDAPIQVLGILESAGLAFDHLWVSGLTEEAWPLAARAHPLIPPALQAKAGIPQASPAISLEVDREFTNAWRGAAPEAIFSSALADGDRELLPSPLIEPMPLEDVAVLGLPLYPLLRDALFAAGRKPGAFSAVADDAGPAIPAAPSKGGTGILADQAACPFRAFAHYRLDARALESPEPGLGPPERGQLLHEMMAHLWKALRDQATLLATPPEQLAVLVEAAAAHAVARVRARSPGRLEGRFAELERERLAGLAHEWLAIESGRPAFEVVFREEPMQLAAGPLQLAGRVDRIDRLQGGGLAIIDYKSGVSSVASWLGERPDDAQLPLYALAAEGDVVHAVAFARLKVGELGFKGLARHEGVLPGVDTVETHRTAKNLAASWDELLAHWRTQVDALGAGFAAGEARVDPKRALATCQRCELQPLCRVHERIGALGEGPGEEED